MKLRVLCADVIMRAAEEGSINGYDSRRADAKNNTKRENV